MAAERSYARLGVFVVVGLIVILVTALFFIERLQSRKVIAFVTYFTENVSGLDISSPVRYRGVSVGRVSDVRIDPRGDAIEVDFELFQDRLAATGESVVRVQHAAELPMSPRLRARVVGNPVTGEGYLLLDVPSNPPPLPVLEFAPKQGYVPSMPSALDTMQERLPAVLARAEEALQTLTGIVERIPDSLDRSDRLLTTVERTIRESQLPQTSADLRTFSTSTTSQIAQIAANLDRLVGGDGSLMKLAEEARGAIREADFPASSKAARDAADRTSLAEDDLRRSLPTILETLAEVRELTRHLDQQPESVVYGPRLPTKTKPR